MPVDLLQGALHRPGVEAVGSTPYVEPSVAHAKRNIELVLDLVRRGVRFAYVPITWREEDQVSNARNWRVFSTGVAGLVRWRLGRAAPAAPEGRDYGVDRVA